MKAIIIMKVKIETDKIAVRELQIIRVKKKL